MTHAGLPFSTPTNAWSPHTTIQLELTDVINTTLVCDHLQRLLALETPRLRTPGLLYDRIQCVPWVDSTQQWARRDVDQSPFQGCFQPRAVLAEYQTGGRGRMNRVWRSAYGDCLMMTVAVSVPKAYLDQRLSLALAVMLCDWFNHHYQFPVRVKWPNDLLFDDKKLAGILIQSTIVDQREAIIYFGVGLNVQTRQAALRDLARPAIGLYETGFHFPTKSELAAEMLLVFLRLLDALACREWDFLSTRWPHCDAYWEQCIRLEAEAAEPVEGVNRGIDAQGRLRVETAMGERLFCVGDVSLRTATAE